MKIAIGGMQKNLMEQEIKKACPDAETIVTNDMNAASMMKKGEVDYYIGACESGSGSAISILTISSKIYALILIIPSLFS